MKHFDIAIGHLMRRHIRNRWERIRLNNPNVSIISNHCMGGIISHDLGLQFLSPTVNLRILPDDFIRFAENLKGYLAQEVTPVEEPSVNYPVGMLGDVKLWFVHYKSFEEAVNCWNRRRKRVNWDNIRVMLTVREMCNDDILGRFEKLPYKKVAYANEAHPEFPSVMHYKNPQGYISDIINIFGTRGYQASGFDYINFLNQ